MSLVQALQGLVGGVNQGLGGFLDNRNQQMEQQNRERIAKVQEAEALRAQQAQQWEEDQAAYKSLMGEIDPSDPLVSRFAGKFPLVKTPSGKLSRPLGAQEQTQLAQIDPNFISQKANLEYAPRAQDSMLDREHDVKLEGLRGQRSAAELANAIAIARLQEQGDTERTGMTTKASMYGADKAYDRTIDAAELKPDKPIDEAQYMVWKLQFLSDHRAREVYNNLAADPSQGPNAAEEALRDKYKRVR